MSSADVIKQMQDGRVEPWLVGAVERLARTVDRSLDAYLVSVGEPSSLTETGTTCRCHFVRRDPQGNPRVSALINKLIDQVVDYCIPRSRIEEASAEMARNGSTEKFVQLQREAKGLFTKVETSGEGGELLLYALLEVALGLPQILCKMSLKTNPQVHYHGVDGVHAKALPNGNLAVYWGEAKLYADVNGAIDAAMKSLGPFLRDAGGGAAERDVLLLRDHVDAGDEELTAALVRYFTDDTLEASHLEVRGACLVGFSMDNYPDPFDDDGQAVRAEITEAIERWHKRLNDAVGKEKLAAFEIEVFCVPLPSVQEFRDLLASRLGLSA